MNHRDHLNDPDYGLDATSTVDRDHALALIGFLKVCAEVVEEPSAMSDRDVARLARAWASSSLPVHRYGPHEAQLDPAGNRGKLTDMLLDAARHLEETIPWPPAN